MIMSQRASRLAGHSGTVAPNASRHRLFTADGQAPGTGGAPPALAAFAAAPATAGSRTAGQNRPAWKEPRDGFPDLHHRAG
jgi:hypothetical protein